MTLYPDTLKQARRLLPLPARAGPREPRVGTWYSHRKVERERISLARKTILVAIESSGCSGSLRDWRSTRLERDRDSDTSKCTSHHTQVPCPSTKCTRTAQLRSDWWWRWRRNVSFSLSLCISISLLRPYTFLSRSPLVFKTLFENACEL